MSSALVYCANMVLICGLSYPTLDHMHFVASGPERKSYGVRGVSDVIMLQICVLSHARDIVTLCVHNVTVSQFFILTTIPPETADSTVRSMSLWFL